MNEDKLDVLITNVTILMNDMNYVKDNFKQLERLPIRVTILEGTVKILNRIAWAIGSTVGIAVIVAILQLIGI